MQVFLHALGCRLNEAELESWARDFQARGLGVTPHAGEADLVVVNTCAVTAEAVRKSRQTLRRARRRNPGARLVVSGCAASLGAVPEGVDLLVPNTAKDRLADIVAEALALPAGAPIPSTAAEPLFARGRSRAFVKVQDGCRHRCSFCIVTVARGAERSRPVAEIVTEVCALAAAGVQEAVLTGVHIGGYGSDIGSSLETLVATVLADTDLPRLRLGSLEPWDLGPGLLRLLENPRFQPHLHLPLQSGSDAVLRRMARRCRTADYARLLEDARAAAPDLAVSTDVIAGFPGESEADFAATLAFCEGMGFSRLHAFPYSPREGTGAARMPDQVPAPERRRRVQALQALDSRLRRRALQDAVGTTAAVLWERAEDLGETRRLVGYTPSYLRVSAETDPATAHRLVNRIAPATVMAVMPDGDAAQARLGD